MLQATAVLQEMQQATADQSHVAAPALEVIYLCPVAVCLVYQLVVCLALLFQRLPQLLQHASNTTHALLHCGLACWLPGFRHSHMHVRLLLLLHGQPSTAAGSGCPGPYLELKLKLLHIARSALLIPELPQLCDLALKAPVLVLKLLQARHGAQEVSHPQLN
jgi:hypothetical protein